MKKIKWDTKSTDLPVFDASIKHPEDPYREFDMELVEVPVDQYLMIQERRRPALVYKKEEESMRAWEKHIEEEQEEYPEGIPTPVLEFENDELSEWQEGYRRGVYAQHKGEEFIPVWMAKKRKRRYI